MNTSGDPYWVYRLSGPAPSGPKPHFQLADGKGERADPATLHQVYSALLQALILTHEHRVCLRTRGLTDEAIDGRSYRSLTPARATPVRKLIEAGFECQLPHVPGFFVRTREDGTSYWTVSGECGLVIPIRDHEGRIIAVLIRRDSEETNKKYSFSSAKKYGGPGPGSPIHIPLHNANDQTVIRVSEGALKSDIATFRSGLLTMGLPGVSAWRRAGKALKVLGAQTVRLAFDADARVNLTVASALSRLAIDLRSSGFAIELERWDSAEGKGIDDVLAAGKVPEVVTGHNVAAAIDDIVAAAAKADPVPGLAIPEGKPFEAEDDPHRLASLFRHTGLSGFGR